MIIFPLFDVYDMDPGLMVIQRSIVTESNSQLKGKLVESPPEQGPDSDYSLSSPCLQNYPTSLQLTPGRLKTIWDINTPEQSQSSPSTPYKSLLLHGRVDPSPGDLETHTLTNTHTYTHTPPRAGPALQPPHTTSPPQHNKPRSPFSRGGGVQFVVGCEGRGRNRANHCEASAGGLAQTTRYGHHSPGVEPPCWGQPTPLPASLPTPTSAGAGQSLFQPHSPSQTFFRDLSTFFFSILSSFKSPFQTLLSFLP